MSKTPKKIQTGIGIDAGGTYTDAVIYSFLNNKILAKAKALTTKEDLTIGISNALDALPIELIRQAQCMALSTTLATNACVEDKGGRGGLIAIGIDKGIINWVGDSYGLPSTDDILFLNAPNEGEHLFDDASFSAFCDQNKSWLESYDGLAIVDLNAGSNSAIFEKEMHAWLSTKFLYPIICGHELSSELNSLRRCAGTLINIRLIPVIAEFLAAIKKVMQHKNIDVPITITRSDGSLMSETFTKIYPVETLLCGPAAGLVGGMHLSHADNSLIIDMGGTTTDISMVQNGNPLQAHKGINIGQWRTFVKGVFVDTFGLGGDTRIYYNRQGIHLDTRRAMPLCVAAQRWPEINTKLKQLVFDKPAGHTRPLHEFFVNIKPLDNPARYSVSEQNIYNALQKGPLSYSEAAEVLQTDAYNIDRNMARLEKEGIVLRCGLTPTDIMQIKKDYNKYDAQASELGMTFIANSLPIDIRLIPDLIYDLVKQTLYSNIARVLLQNQYPKWQGKDLPDDINNIIQESWLLFKNKKSTPILSLLFQTPLTLVGLGAPIHIFLPEVAKALNASFTVPKEAGVANALGAIIGQIETNYKVNVYPGLDGLGYHVEGPYEHFYSESDEEAFANAMAQSERAAREEALRRGITGEISVKSQLIHNEAMSTYNMPVYLGSTAITTVRGSAHE